MTFLMQKVKRFLLSRNTVISLICAVGISCVVGSTIPQVAGQTPQFFEEWKAESPRIYHFIDLLQFNRVYTSAWFLILVALIALSLSYSIYHQSKVLIKSKRPAQREITEHSFKDFLSLRIVHWSGVRVDGLAHVIKEVFEAKGYRPYLMADESKYFVFGKNRAGRWGNVIFHTGLLFCIAAALYGLALQKRGFIQLKETSAFQGNDEDWTAKTLGVFAGDFNLGFQIVLNKFSPVYWENDKVKDLKSSLTLVDTKGSASQFALSPVSPVDINGTRVYQSNYYGYALGFVMQKEDGNKVFCDFLLNAPGKKDEAFVGKTDFPSTDYMIEMEFHPNLIKPSFYATLPGVDLTVTENGEQRFKGRVLFSQRARLNKDSLAFVRIRYWTGLNFVRNYGMPLVYICFALITLGSILIFVLPYKEICVKIAQEGDDVRVHIGGQTKRYGALFSLEFKVLAERLEGLLGEHGKHSVAQV